MKKLMVAAAAVAMTAGAFAEICNDTEIDTCLAYDLSIKVKTLGPKATTCKVQESVCDDVEKVKIYFLDDTSRTFVGYAWTCEYACGGDFNVAIWDKKAPQAIALGDGTDSLSFMTDDCFRYGKKADKVAAAFDLSTTGADLKLAGVKGKLVAAADGEYNFVKSISGNCAGKVAFYVKPGRKIVNKTGGNICEDPVIEEEECDDVEVLRVGLCDCFTSYCEDGEAYDDMVPATGTWSLKYNKKVSQGKKGQMRLLIPAYAW